MNPVDVNTKVNILLLAQAIHMRSLSTTTSFVWPIPELVAGAQAFCRSYNNGGVSRWWNRHSMSKAQVEWVWISCRHPWVVQIGLHETQTSLDFDSFSLDCHFLATMDPRIRSRKTTHNLILKIFKVWTHVDYICPRAYVATRVSYSTYKAHAQACMRMRAEETANFLPFCTYCTQWGTIWAASILSTTKNLSSGERAADSWTMVREQTLVLCHTFVLCFGRALIGIHLNCPLHSSHHQVRPVGPARLSLTPLTDCAYALWLRYRAGCLCREESRHLCSQCPLWWCGVVAYERDERAWDEMRWESQYWRNCVLNASRV